jgi:hypothetical protein
MAAGTLRRMDPGAATRCFAGPLIIYLVAREIFPQPDARTLSAETMAAAAVDVFLRGMEVAHAVLPTGAAASADGGQVPAAKSAPTAGA